MGRAVVLMVFLALAGCANIQHGYRAGLECHSIHGEPGYDGCVKEAISRQEEQERLAEEAERQWRASHPVEVAQVEAYKSAQWANTANGMAAAVNMMNQADYQNQMLWQQQQMNNNLQLLYHQQAMQNAREAAQPYIHPFIDSGMK